MDVAAGRGLADLWGMIGTLVLGILVVTIVGFLLFIVFLVAVS